MSFRRWTLVILLLRLQSFFCLSEKGMQAKRPPPHCRLLINYPPSLWPQSLVFSCFVLQYVFILWQAEAPHNTAATQTTLSALTFMPLISVESDVLSNFLFERLVTFSVSLTPHHSFLSTVGFYWNVWEPVGVCLEPYFLWITLCHPPITGRSRCHHVYAHVRSESV